MLNARFLLLLLTAAIFGMAFSTYFLLPKYLAVELAAEAATIGSVSAISWFASVCVVPFVGVQIDRHGRKYFACLGAALFAIACAGFLWVDSVGPLLWGLRILQGCAFTLFFVSLSTLAIDISPAERLGQAIGLFGAVMISTNALGPALAEPGAALFGWRAIFICTAGAASLAAVLTLCLREQPVAHARAEATSMLQVFRRPGLRPVLAVAAMIGWNFGAVFTFYQPWALARGIAQVSSFLIAYALCAMLARLFLSGLADRLGRLRVAKVTLLLYIPVPFALIYLDIFGLFLTGSLLGLAHGLFYPALNAVAVDYVALGERGKVMAAYNGAFNIGFSGGSFLLGYVAMATGYPTVFLIAGLTCIAAAGVLHSVQRVTPHERR